MSSVRQDLSQLFAHAWHQQLKPFQFVQEVDEFKRNCELKDVRELPYQLAELLMQYVSGQSFSSPLLTQYIQNLIAMDILPAHLFLSVLLAHWNASPNDEDYVSKVSFCFEFVSSFLPALPAPQSSRHDNFGKTAKDSGIKTENEMEIEEEEEEEKSNLRQSSPFSSLLMVLQWLLDVFSVDHLKLPVIKHVKQILFCKRLSLVLIVAASQQHDRWAKTIKPKLAEVLFCAQQDPALKEEMLGVFNRFFFVCSRVFITHFKHSPALSFCLDVTCSDGVEVLLSNDFPIPGFQAWIEQLLMSARLPDRAEVKAILSRVGVAFNVRLDIFCLYLMKVPLNMALTSPNPHPSSQALTAFACAGAPFIVHDLLMDYLQMLLYIAGDLLPLIWARWPTALSACSIPAAAILDCFTLSSPTPSSSSSSPLAAPTAATGDTLSPAPFSTPYSYEKGDESAPKQSQYGVVNIIQAVLASLQHLRTEQCVSTPREGVDGGAEPAHCAPAFQLAQHCGCLFPPMMQVFEPSRFLFYVWRVVAGFSPCVQHNLAHGLFLANVVSAPLPQFSPPLPEALTPFYTVLPPPSVPPNLPVLFGALHWSEPERISSADILEHIRSLPLDTLTNLQLVEESCRFLKEMILGGSEFLTTTGRSMSGQFAATKIVSVLPFVIGYLSRQLPGHDAAVLVFERFFQGLFLDVTVLEVLRVFGTLPVCLRRIEKLVLMTSLHCKDHPASPSAPSTLPPPPPPTAASISTATTTAADAQSSSSPPSKRPRMGPCVGRSPDATQRPSPQQDFHYDSFSSVPTLREDQLWESAGFCLLLRASLRPRVGRLVQMIAISVEGVYGREFCVSCGFHTLNEPYAACYSSYPTRTSSVTPTPEERLPPPCFPSLLPPTPPGGEIVFSALDKPPPLDSNSSTAQQTTAAASALPPESGGGSGAKEPADPCVEEQERDMESAYVRESRAEKCTELLTLLRAETGQPGPHREALLAFIHGYKDVRAFGKHIRYCCSLLSGLEEELQKKSLESSGLNQSVPSLTAKAPEKKPFSEPLLQCISALTHLKPMEWSLTVYVLCSLIISLPRLPLTPSSSLPVITYALSHLLSSAKQNPHASLLPALQSFLTAAHSVATAHNHVAMAQLAEHPAADWTTAQKAWHLIAHHKILPLLVSYCVNYIKRQVGCEEIRAWPHPASPDTMFRGVLFDLCSHPHPLSSASISLHSYIKVLGYSTTPELCSQWAISSLIQLSRNRFKIAHTGEPPMFPRLISFLSLLLSQTPSHTAHLLRSSITPVFSFPPGPESDPHEAYLLGFLAVLTTMTHLTIFSKTVDQELLTAFNDFCVTLAQIIINAANSALAHPLALYYTLPVLRLACLSPRYGEFPEFSKVFIRILSNLEIAYALSFMGESTLAAQLLAINPDPSLLLTLLSSNNFT